MKNLRFHPAVGIPVLCLVGAVIANAHTPDWQGQFAAYLGASILLASPFAVLLLGHLTLAKTWRRHLFLAAGSFLFVGAWSMASFAMGWFKPGWFGAILFGVVLALLAGAYVSLSLSVQEGSRAQAV